MTPLIATYILWFLWLLLWWFLALRWRHPAEKHAGLGGEIFTRLLAFIGFIPLFGLFPNRYDLLFKIPAPEGIAGWLLFLLAVAGFGFGIWARVKLGHLWSSTVTRKRDHRIIDTGPYRLVRHPIYSGLILAVFVTAILHATPSSMLGAIVVTLSWVMKARLEEAFLREELGAAYDDYADKVPMLVPHLHF